MALTPVPAVTTAATQKQIVVRAPSGGGTMYTVPAGKTFTGFAIAGPSNSCQINLNGIEIWSQSGTTPYYATPIPLNLVAGTVVSSGGSYTSWTLYGTEQ